MKQQIENAFPHAKNCFESNESDSCSVAEHEQTQKCYLIDNIEEGILKIANSSKKMIYLLAIDHCLFSSTDQMRCDCAVFNEEIFYFIEIKDSLSKKQLSDHRYKAINQLRETLQLFTEQLNFEYYQQNNQLNAVICFRFEKRYPAQVTKREHATVDFWDNFNANLLEGNEIKFVVRSY